MEEAETRATQLSRSKSLLQTQVEDLKKQLDEEVKVCVPAPCGNAGDEHDGFHSERRVSRGVCVCVCVSPV